MRRATALLLTLFCGSLLSLFLRELWLGVAPMIGLAKSGAPRPANGLFFVVGILSGFGSYAGVRALFTRTARPATDRAVRIAGWVIVSFSALGLLVAANLARFFGPVLGVMYAFGASGLGLWLGAACIFAFRKR